MFTIGSLFSGGGGWEEGAKLVGGRVLWGVELDPDASAAWRRNNSFADMREQSVLTLDPASLASVDVQVWSPPCQWYSKARRSDAQTSATSCDPRVGADCLRYAAALRPRFVLLENVAQYAGSAPLRHLQKGMAKLGYHGVQAVLDAERHGLPSRRKRLYVVWSRDGAVNPFSTLPYLTRSWDGALQGLSFPRGLPVSPRVLRGLQVRPPTAYPLLLTGAWSVSTKVVAGKTERIYHTEPGRPGPTMTASYGGMHGYRILHADGSVQAFTPRGAARLMGFPDSYILPSDPATAYSVVGNAVSPLMSALLLWGLSLA
jgi:DNA (cytosine-5)-methyltransferase 1